METWKTNPYPYQGSNNTNNIRQPETPVEPMEFLSRSWSLSAAEISKAFASAASLKPKQSILQPFITSQPQPEPVTSIISELQNSRDVERVVTRPRAKWFNHKETTTRNVRKKDKLRAEKAQTHAALCVAGLATALASITAAKPLDDDSGKMISALASATELLATHCSELAESAGADHHLVVSVVQSAINVQTPSDLLTLTAAAATALRGEAAVKARFSKEAAKKNAATVIPCEKHMLPDAAVQNETRKRDHPCSQEMLQQVYKGGLRWKQVSVYINNKSQVIIKLKSNHVGGAFSTKNKGVVYGVCNEKASWPFCKERENADDDAYFGVKTAKGLLEFKCKNKLYKQKWVDTIQYLLLLQR